MPSWVIVHTHRLGQQEAEYQDEELRGECRSPHVIPQIQAEIGLVLRAGGNGRTDGSESFFLGS